MGQTQDFLRANGLVIAEVLPQFHHYHLDDSPDLTSCSLVAIRQGDEGIKSFSENLPVEDLENFYGSFAPLDVHYVLDLRKGGAFPSRDYHLERLG